MSQVNLLPPELRARQKTKQLTTLIVGGGAAIIILLLAFWFLQGQKLAGVNDDIAAQNLTNSGLQTQIDQLQEFQQLQEEAAKETAEASAGGGMVTVVVNGSKQVQSLKIDPEVVSKEDVEMLQDLILAAINDAHRKAEEAMSQQMSGMMGGLKMPGMF